VNGIGDVDVANEALCVAELLIGLTSAPVLNVPAAIQATSRCENPCRKIHYFRSDMVDRPDHRAEDANSLADMPGMLGAKAMADLERIRIALNLDYGGIDFGLSEQGEILLFEANAAMVVQQPDEGEQWDYRRPAVELIHNAVRQLLLMRAGVVSA
jgi:hypothetical protein